MNPVGASLGFFSLILILVYIAIVGLGIYCLILFIKLAHRGIQALDIHLDEKRNKPPGQLHKHGE